MFKLRSPVVALCASLLLTSMGFAGDDCCDNCGCQSPLARVCRPIHSTRQEEVTVWDVVYEEYCPGRRVSPVNRCESCCTAPVACTDCQRGGREPRTRKRLIRKQIVRQVPTILWVSEYRCTDCASQLPPQALPTDPQANGKPVSTWQWLLGTITSSPSNQETSHEQPLP